MKQSQMKNFKLYFTISEILKVSDGLKRRLETAEDKIGKLEDRPIEGSQSKEQRKQA